MHDEPPPEKLAALLQAIAAKKERLDRMRPLPAEALSRLEHYYDIELTYTSNAIEGNTLSPLETTLVIEYGITIGGKPLKDRSRPDIAGRYADLNRYARTETMKFRQDLQCSNLSWT